MSTETRCAECGALVVAGSGWCGLCYAPIAAPRTADAALDAPDGGGAAFLDLPMTGGEPRLAAPGAGSDAPPIEAIRDDDGRPAATWPCPVCSFANPLELDACAACGAPFSKLFEDPRRTAAVAPREAIRRSLLFPGLGHMKLGRTADGIARAIMFAWALGTALLLVVSRPASGGPGFILPLTGLFVVASAVLYATAAMDAGRAAEGRTPLLSARVLLYGTAGLMLLSVVALFVLVSQASPSSLPPGAPLPVAPAQ